MRNKKARAAANSGHSIALWCKSTGAPVDIKLHVNLWRLDERTNGLGIDALDFGILMSNPVGLETVSLFLPFPVQPSHLLDLGALLTQTDLAVAIFNEAVKVSLPSSNVADFSIELRKEVVWCRKLALSSDLSITSVTDEKSNIVVGSTLAFSKSAFTPTVDGEFRYVRFRVKLSEAGRAAFFTRYDPTDRRLLSGYDETEVVDFRLNERRNLPRNVISEMALGSDFRLKEINYFVIRHITDDLTLSHGELKKCRTLESGVWTGYLAPNEVNRMPLRNALIFYWRRKADGDTIDDWNALARFRKRKTNWVTIGVSVAILLFVGICSSYVAGLLPQPGSHSASKAINAPSTGPNTPPGPPDLKGSLLPSQPTSPR